MLQETLVIILSVFFWTVRIFCMVQLAIGSHTNEACRRIRSLKSSLFGKLKSLFGKLKSLANRRHARSLRTVKILRKVSSASFLKVRVKSKNMPKRLTFRSKCTSSPRRGTGGDDARFWKSKQQWF